MTIIFSLFFLGCGVPQDSATVDTLDEGTMVVEGIDLPEELDSFRATVLLRERYGGAGGFDYELRGDAVSPSGEVGVGVTLFGPVGDQLALVGVHPLDEHAMGEHEMGEFSARDQIGLGVGDDRWLAEDGEVTLTRMDHGVVEGTFAATFAPILENDGSELDLTGAFSGPVGVSCSLLVEDPDNDSLWERVDAGHPDCAPLYD